MTSLNGDLPSSESWTTPRVDLPLSDADLLAACRSGDAGAWDELLHRYERLVYSVARRNGLDSDDAADVCQSTFVALLESIDAIRDDRQLAYWLMTVSRRQAWRCRQLKEREHLSSTLPDIAAAPIEGWERVADLHSALARVGEPCRTLLVGLYLEADQPSYAQLAARLGRSIGGIGPLRGRCLERLRGVLDERPDAPDIPGDRARYGGPRR